MENNLKNRGSVVIILIIVIILLAGGFLLYSRLPFFNKTPAEIAVSEASVTINNQGFIPATISVKKGTQVTWVNKDNNLHRIVSDPHPTHDGLENLDSEEPLAKNDSFSFIFENVGTYTYHSEEDPLKIKGTVIVE